MADRLWGENVKIVKIPITWGEAELPIETNGRRELQSYLDDGYHLLSTVTIVLDTKSVVIYTLYDDGSD